MLHHPGLRAIAAALALVCAGPAVAADVLDAAVGAPLVDVLSPDVLATLEDRGFSFSALLGAPPHLSNEALVAAPAHSAWRDIVSVLTGDLARIGTAIEGTVDDAHQFRVRALARGSAEAYRIEQQGDAPRQFDGRWLRSPLAHMKLVAVVPRYDRRDFDPESPCGELRFIYRLAYRVDRPPGPAIRSTLPFFVNVVARASVGVGCRAFLEGWMAPTDDAAALARWLLAHPLSSPLAIKQVEINFQSLRFSAGYMKDFGGQALYIMRIFRADARGAYVPAPLENTPDVAAVRADPSLRDELLAFLQRPENLHKLDEGTLVVPDFKGRFLARLAFSWSTLGRARIGNKPFSDLLSAPQDAAQSTMDPSVRARLDALDLTPLRVIGNTDGLVERLNNLSCMGCHQSGGTAGFHMLGLADDRVTDAYNQQEVPFSPHYAAERSRRAHLHAAAHAQRPAPRFRPHSFFPSADWDSAASMPRFRAARAKEACVVDAGALRASFSCEAGTTCVRTVAATGLPVPFGECIADPEASSPPFAGSACQPGTVERGPRGAAAGLPVSTLDFLDRFVPGAPLYPRLAAKHSRSEQSCRPPVIGVPLGRTFRLCTERERRLDDVAERTAAGAGVDQICAAVGGSKFEECATGDDVLACLAGAVTRGMVDTCSPTRPCREDYICQRLPRQLPGVVDAARIDALHAHHVGFCTPTYFLFNMRADGHPDALTGTASPLLPEQRAREFRGGYNATGTAKRSP